MQNKKGFTLIELLVVVLIIGILAAVALPQYNKAVWKSRNMQLKMLLTSIAQAENAYLVENGQYAENFKELSLEVPFPSPGETGNESICSISLSGTDGVRRSSNFQVILNMPNEEGGGVVGVWTDGPYKCEGFSYQFSTSKIACLSRKSSSSFCKTIEKGASPDHAGSWYWYAIP